jgi:Tfp pilus assembly protein PilV
MSIVEVLVAISIITVGVLGLLASLASEQKGQAAEKSRTTAIHLAAGVLESAQAQPYASLTTIGGTYSKTINGVLYTYTTTAQQCSATDNPNTCTTPGSGVPSTVHAGVVVRWTQGGQQRSVTMQRAFANDSTTTTGGTSSPLGSCGGSGVTLVAGSLSLSPSTVTVDTNGNPTSNVTVTLTQTGLSSTNTSCVPLTWSDDSGSHQVSMTPSGTSYTVTIPKSSITRAASTSSSTVVFTATVPGSQAVPSVTLTVQGKPAFTACSVSVVGLGLNTITLAPLTRNTLLAATLSCTTTNLTTADSVTATYASGTTTKTVSMTSSDGTTWSTTLPAGTAMVKTGTSESITFALTRASDSQTATQSLTATLA